MSILVEIAGKADVSVEGVVRVLTKEPVSAAVKERVLAVLDQLDAEQTRVLERFALAAVHDVVPLDADEGAPPPDGTEPAEPSVHDGQLAIGESPAAVTGLDRADQAGLERHAGEELPVGLGTLLEELVSAVWEMRHESRTNRQERLDDLAVLVDLMTTSWQGVDRRLARLEQLLARRDASWHTLAPVVPPPEPPVLAPIRDEAPPPPERAAEEPDTPSGAAPSDAKRRWPPLAGTLLLLVCLVGAMLLFDLLPSRAEGPRLLPARGDGTTQATTGSSSAQSGSTQPGSSSPTESTTRPSAPARTTTGAGASAPPSARRTAPPNTVPPTTQRSTTPAPQRPPGTSTGATRPAPPPTTRPTPPRAAIQPARVFVWPPHRNAVGYSVWFYRGEAEIYSTQVTKPRLTLPKRIVFRPGTYRWVVVPDRGPLGLGEPIIDSSFTVAKP